MIFDDVLKNKMPVYDKLLAFGFEVQDGVYVYSRAIVDKQFDFVVNIFPDGKVKTQVIDLATKDEYVLPLIESVSGGFIGKVRLECLDVLQKIVDNCFVAKIFKSPSTAQVVRYIKEKYQHDLEFLWPKSPQSAIVRRADNKKWYAVILVVEKNKLGLDSKEKTEIINLRGRPEEIKNIIDGKKYFACYHMNKKYWMSICLDGSVEIDEILARIDESYVLAKKH